MFNLKPSEIRYSQDSISNFFDSKCNHSHKMIGETLDDICENRCSIHEISTIRVLLDNFEWTTSDNRRLWVFQHLERLGKCNEIPVIETYYIPDTKLTSQNGGLSVRVRGNPGGIWHKMPRKTSVGLQRQRSPQIQNLPTSANLGYGYSVNRSYLNSAGSQTSYSDRPQMGYNYDRSQIGYNQGFTSTNGYSSSIRRATPQESYDYIGRSSFRVPDGYTSGTRRPEYETPQHSVKRNDSWCTIL